MNDFKIYDGFDMDEQVEYENNIKDKCPNSEAGLDKSCAKANNYSK